MNDTTAQEETWSPDYTFEWKRRQIMLVRLAKASERELAAVHQFYRSHPIEWIEDWCITIDPRNVTDPAHPTLMPFILFDKQKEVVHWLHSHILKKPANGLIEKCRDMGVTWICNAFSVWLWRYYQHICVGWGSRKEDLVDLQNNPSSIFPRMREIIKNLPPFMLPAGFDLKRNAPHMRITNPQNGSSIIGEAGDNIGRGGRTTVYFKDESAYYENPLSIEGALGENTNVQIDISTHNGTDTLFYQKTQTYDESDKFVLDWWNHPLHDEAWHEERKHYYCVKLGAPHLFAQEIERDPTGSVLGLVIPQHFVRAAIDAHKKLGYTPESSPRAALDVADEGGDWNVVVARQDFLLYDLRARQEGTTTETTDWAIDFCISHGLPVLVYDSIGVGAGVKGTLKERNPDEIGAIGWNAGAGVVDPHLEFCEGKRNRDMFANAKAQAWWNLRLRFTRTWEALQNDELFDPSSMIAIDSDMPELSTLMMELSQPTFSINNNGKIVIDKKPDGAKSPNRADAAMIAFAPLDERRADVRAVKGMY